MKGQQKSGRPLGLWEVAALVIGGLLYVAVVLFLILLLAGRALLADALELGFLAGVLLLVGIFLYLAGKRRGMARFWRRFLLGALVATGLLLALFSVAIGLLLFQSTGGCLLYTSLYDEEIATFDEDEVYNQADSAGFINLFGLPIKVQAKKGLTYDK